MKEFGVFNIQTEGFYYYYYYYYRVFFSLAFFDNKQFVISSFNRKNFEFGLARRPAFTR